MSEPFTAEEIAELRRATPGTAEVNHLNHAGSSLPSQSVLDTQLSFLEREAMIGGYEAAIEAAEVEADVYGSIARLIGSEQHEIAKVESATVAWNHAFWSLPMRAGQRILTADVAYGANAVGFMRARDREGIEIDVVPSDQHGQVDIAELERRLDDSVALVAITHVPTNGGLVNPASEIGALTRAAGVPYLLDACQSAGQLDLDVDDLGCDLMSVTGRKFLRGPRGTGFLYVRDSIVDRLVPDHPDHVGANWNRPDSYELRPHALRFEYYEYSHAGWIALGRAAEEAHALGLDRIEATVVERADQLRDRLGEAGFPNHDLGVRRCGIVTTIVDGHDAFAVRDALRSRNINVSVTTEDNTRWDFERRDLPPMLRLSVHYLTTDDELAEAVDALREISMG